MGLWGVMQALAQGFGAIGGGLARDVAEQMTGNVALGYVVVYATALGLLLLALVLIGAMRLGRQLDGGAARSPWAGLQDVPADQLIA
jgi:BCD family chlorophyll transporter-like MFS transporter